MTWTPQNIPDLKGTVALVTGANSGIGFEAARILASQGASVALACRNPDKAAEAIEKIVAAHPEAKVEFLQLDLASLASVKTASQTFLAAHDRLDLLINNAGVMALPYRKTEDGFEMQIGVNHLGHFALTGHLFDRLVGTTRSRVVNVSSVMHRIGTMNWDDLQGERRYRKWPAYGQSKLANLLFTYEMDRRLKSRGIEVSALACHPGYAATNLQFVGPEMVGSGLMARINGLGNAIMAQSAEQGAWPTVSAATNPMARSGDYFGPDGMMEMRGNPHKVSSNKASRSAEDGARLWRVSEELTGVRFLS